MQTSYPVNDGILWERFQEGDSEALGQLMTSHYTALIQYGTKFNRDTTFIRDCMQDIFVELWNRRSTLSSLTSGQVRPYLMTMLRRFLHQDFISRQKIDFQPLSDCIDSSLFSLNFSPEAEIIERERIQEHQTRIQYQLDQLPRRAKEIIYLRFFENIDRAGIAQIMGISEQSVSNLLQATFRQLRKQMSTDFLWLVLTLCILY